ncbi:hypothetical protein J6TS2_38020 [Heyndrickxia sporothermodurans]|nr:hypothetical protein J6TS2_38020 [Heyndrickxia sporothermodurans]
MNFFKRVPEEVQYVRLQLNTLSQTKKLTLCSILTCSAAIFQASGGFLPVFGYIISIFSTAPVIFCSLISIQFGILSYVLTIILLVMLQPSEVLIYSFTTGLLGLGIGISILYLNRKVTIIFCSSLYLVFGILVLLYALKFPILGPIGSKTFSLWETLGIFLFSFFYSLIWVELCLFCLKRLRVIFKF